MIGSRVRFVFLMILLEVWLPAIAAGDPSPKRKKRKPKLIRLEHHHPQGPVKLPTLRFFPDDPMTMSEFLRTEN
jgi:hypothetical protein